MGYIFVLVTLPIVIPILILLAKDKKNSTLPIRIILFILLVTSLIPSVKLQSNEVTSLLQLAIKGDFYLLLTLLSYLITFFLLFSKRSYILKFSMLVFYTGYAAYMISGFIGNGILIPGVFTIPFLYMILPVISLLFYIPVFWTSRKLSSKGFNESTPITKEDLLTSFRTLGLGFLILIVGVILIAIINPQLLADFVRWWYGRGHT